jgi:hypothetical protein
MVELKVMISDEAATRLAQRAREEKSTPEKVASQALDALLGKAPTVRRPRFVGKGHSGRHDLSENVEEIIAADLGA